MSKIKQKYPILEYDSESAPIIVATSLYDKSRNPRGITRCLFTYFQDVVEKYENADKINQTFRLRTEGVRPRVYEKQYKMPDGRMEYIYVVPMPLGAPIAARMLESMSAVGCNKFMVCGGAGALDDAVTKCDVLIPTCAVRDEGTSYHYLPPARDVSVNSAVLNSIKHTLDVLAKNTWK